MKVKTIKKICDSALISKSCPAKAKVVSGFRSVLPTGSKPWVSVEIECFFLPKKQAKVNKKHEVDFREVDWYSVVSTAVAKANLSSYVRVKDDGSIEPDDLECCNGAMEVVVSAPESKIFFVLEKVCLILNNFGAKTNDTCGLHIHLDHRLETNRNPILSYNNLFYTQDILFKISNPSRKNCGFCDVVSKNMFENFVNDNRYNSINALSLETHDTLEVRVFQGTTDFHEISHFIRLLLGVINNKKPIKSKVDKNNIDCFKSIPLVTRRFVKSKLLNKKKRKAA
jgi:hypothetical protein